MLPGTTATRFLWYYERHHAPINGPTMGHGGPNSVSNQSLALISSLVKTGGRSSPFIADKSKKSLSFIHSQQLLFEKNPDTKMTLPPAAYTSSPVSSLLTLLDPKHHLHHPPYIYDDCPNGWEFDDNLINNGNTTTPNDITTTNFAYNNQSVRWGFGNKFIFDLKAKTTTDNAMDTTESIVTFDISLF